MFQHDYPTDIHVIHTHINSDHALRFQLSLHIHSEIKDACYRLLWSLILIYLVVMHHSIAYLKSICY